LEAYIKFIYFRKITGNISGKSKGSGDRRLGKKTNTWTGGMA
jgi:hypothetical protein